MQDIKKMKDADVVSAIHEQRNALRTARFGATGSRAKNVKAVKHMRKDIARLMTEVSSRKKAAKVAKA